MGMVFGEGYDKALWLMLKFNKVDRINIINFMREIPYELYNEINNNIYNLNDSLINGSFLVEDKMYYYRFNPHNYCLSVGRSKNNDGIYNEEIELSLKYISRYNLNNGYNLMISSIQYNNGNIRKLCLGDDVLSWDFCRYVLLINNNYDVENIDIINVNSILNILDGKNLINDKVFVKKRG